MFERKPQKTQSPKPKSLEGLTPILLPTQLITHNKRQAQLDKIAKASQFDAGRFEMLCQRLVYAILNYTQELPETTNSYFSTAGGLFDHALSRTSAALDLFQQYVLVNPKAILTEEQQLWWYALFSAGLLKGMSKVALDLSVQCYNPQGVLLKKWEPLLEPLSKNTRYYQYEFDYAPAEENFRQQLNLIFAKILMPPEGFAWLSQHLDVFEVWLALLAEDDSDSSGTLSLILDRADAIAVQEDLLNTTGHVHPKDVPTGRIGSFIDTPEASLLDKEQQLGKEFLEWLIAELEAGHLTFNHHALSIVAAGTYIGPDAIKLFCQAKGIHSIAAVQRGVMSLGIQHTDDASHTKEEGITIKNSIALPQHLEEKNVLDVLSDGTRKQLSSRGKWEAPEAESNAPHIKPTQNPYG